MAVLMSYIHEEQGRGQVPEGIIGFLGRRPTYERRYLCRCGEELLHQHERTNACAAFVSVSTRSWTILVTTLVPAGRSSVFGRTIDTHYFHPAEGRPYQSATPQHTFADDKVWGKMIYCHPKNSALIYTLRLACLMILPTDLAWYVKVHHWFFVFQAQLNGPSTLNEFCCQVQQTVLLFQCCNELWCCIFKNKSNCIIQYAFVLSTQMTEQMLVSKSQLCLSLPPRVLTVSPGYVALLVNISSLFVSFFFFSFCLKHVLHSPYFTRW
jgi:hypothetical protein